MPCDWSYISATRCPSRVDFANSAASGPQHPTVYPGFLVSGVSIPNSLMRRRPRTSSSMSTVSPSTTFNTTAVVLTGSAHAVGASASKGAAIIAAAIATRKPIGVPLTRDAIAIAVLGLAVVGVALWDVAFFGVVGCGAVRVVAPVARALRGAGLID